MKYQKVIRIGSLCAEQIQKLQPGQWVYADTDSPLGRGRFWGVKPSGSVVVAWQGNAKQKPNWAEYQTALRTYARG